MLCVFLVAREKEKKGILVCSSQSSEPFPFREWAFPVFVGQTALAYKRKKG
jgi:hypothetical protein